MSACKNQSIFMIQPTGQSSETPFPLKPTDALKIEYNTTSKTTTHVV